MLRGFLTDIVIVSIEPQMLKVKSLYKNREYSGPPHLSVEAGYAFSRAGTEDINDTNIDFKEPVTVAPFSNSRIVVTDSDIAGKLLRQFLCKLYGRNYLLPSISMFLYPPSNLRNDLTNLEVNALTDAAHKAGARIVYLITDGKEVSIKNLKDLKQISNGEALKMRRAKFIESKARRQIT